ncbi:MAG: class I SAM-dependent methyltransferase [Spirochaetes bacterium]|nr:class I SAM-dependent methyltransferase [Spirochaetota bacterium]
MKKWAKKILLIPILAASCCSAERTAEHFNSIASDPGSKAEQIIQSLEIKKGSAIADLGSGGGYFTIRLAEETGPAGRIYAVDIDRDLLEIVTRDSKKKNLHNVIAVAATPGDSGLPDRGVDLIFIRNVFHDIGNPEYFRKLAGRLRKGGRLAIIDYKPGFIATAFHNVPEEKILKVMADSGYTRIKRYTFLENQSFNLFELKKDLK